MSKYCKGCGILLQHDHPDQLGYSVNEDDELCQRCFRIRHYGDVTIPMQQGIESNATLDKINEIDGTVFWIADLFSLESSLISRLNQKLPGKDIVMVLTKRDLLPSTLSDQKIRSFVMEQLKKDNIQVKDIVITGGLLKKGDEAKRSISRLKNAIDKYRHNNIIFMGTANAGKSTLINRLLDSEDLTISRNPGTTLDMVRIPNEDYLVYDTPGLENYGSVLSWLPAKELKKVIPAKPIKPVVYQIDQDQSFAAGGLARLDVYTHSKATVTCYFPPMVPVHRGKVSDADRLWSAHLGEMLSPALDETMETMTAFTAPKMKKHEKMDVVISGLGWFCLSGPIEKAVVFVHKGIQVEFRKAMI